MNSTPFNLKLHINTNKPFIDPPEKNNNRKIKTQKFDKLNRN